MNGKYSHALAIPILSQQVHLCTLLDASNTDINAYDCIHYIIGSNFKKILKVINNI